MNKLICNFYLLGEIPCLPQRLSDCYPPFLCSSCLSPRPGEQRSHSYPHLAADCGVPQASPHQMDRDTHRWTAPSLSGRGPEHLPHSRILNSFAAPPFIPWPSRWPAGSGFFISCPIWRSGWLQNVHDFAFQKGLKMKRASLLVVEEGTRSVFTALRNSSELLSQLL